MGKCPDGEVGKTENERGDRKLRAQWERTKERKERKDHVGGRQALPRRGEQVSYFAWGTSNDLEKHSEALFGFTSLHSSPLFPKLLVLQGATTRPWHRVLTAVS